MRGKKKSKVKTKSKSKKTLRTPPLALIPSQAVSTLTLQHQQKLSHYEYEHEVADDTSAFTYATDSPSHSSKIQMKLYGSSTDDNGGYDSGGDEIVYTESSFTATDSHPTSNKNKKKSVSMFTTTKNKDDDSSSSSSKSSSQRNPNPTGTSKNKNRLRRSGNVPDIYWRAIPMSHLRQHPLYQPLPHPTEIKSIKNLEDVRHFRQDSWQWDALHAGRCTTSQASPALGFLEPRAASMLGIPRSLQKNCMGAFQRLRSPSLRTLEDMNRVLCDHGDEDDVDVDRMMEEEEGTDGVQSVKSLWSRRISPHYPFAAKYIPVVTQRQLKEKRVDAKKYMSRVHGVIGIRMNWGNSQEPMAILTALNYFAKHSPGMVMKEVGMCGAGLATNTTASGDGLIIGASPDSVIEHANGTLEVLEVKNHCPFVKTPKSKKSKAKGKKSSSSSSSAPQETGDFRIRILPLEASVPTAYIPQLMMEMVCLGEKCKSAVMVRQTATNGAIILRVHRNDEWIEEMMYWLQRFMDDYVNVGKVPPPNFFFEEDRYKAFLEMTIELSKGVEFVDYVSHGAIQRVLADRGLALPLFLD